MIRTASRQVLLEGCADDPGGSPLKEDGAAKLDQSAARKPVMANCAQESCAVAQGRVPDCGDRAIHLPMVGCHGSGRAGASWVNGGRGGVREPAARKAPREVGQARRGGAAHR